MLVLVIVVSYGGVFKPSMFKKVIKNVPKNKLVKTTNNLKNSKSLKEIVDVKKLKRLSPVDQLTHTAQTIAGRSSAANKIMATKDPLYAIQLYAKGGDKLFDDMGVLAKKTMKTTSNTVSKIQAKIPSVKKLPKLSESQLFNKMISVAKITGETGLKITKGIAKIARNNPKSSIAGVLYGWYLSDPVGFKKELEEFGGSVEEFAKHIGNLIGDTAIGIVGGVTEGIVTAIKENMSPASILAVIALALVWLLYKFRDMLSLKKIFIRKDESVTSKRKKRKSRRL